MKTKFLVSVIIVLLLPMGCTWTNFTSPFIHPTATPSPTQTPKSQEIGSFTPPPSISMSAAPFNISWDDRSLFHQRLTSSYQNILNGLAGASMYHLAFSLSNPPILANGIEEIRYTNQENVALTEVDFAIFPEILGGGIKINQTSTNDRPVTPILSAGLMRLPLTVPLAPGSSVIFHIEFSVTIPTKGGDFYYGIFGYNNGILSLAQAYPTILVYDENGWNNQTPDLNGDPLFSDPSFYLVSIDAPADLTLVASGAEVGSQVLAGRQQVLYAGGPARDFYLAASSSFNKETKKVGETTLNSFTPPDLTKSSQSVINIAEAAIDDFNQRYAPYPYTDFNIVPIVTSAGGVEFPGMTAIAEGVYNQGNFLESVLVHEIVHQWFYNMVGNETQMQPWLDESLAQFATCQYYLDRHGIQAEESCLGVMKARWDQVDAQKIPIGQSVSAYSADEYGAVVYGRGALFFQALRQQIGQATFDILMHDYATSFTWKIATTEDFKKLAEKHCNCDLTKLFKEWIYP